MKIAIFGAGQLGIHLTQKLVDKHEICVIDLNEEKLGFISSTFDIQTIQGHATRPDIMLKANLKDTDIVIAVTSSDEININICDIAYKLYKTPYKIARIRDSEYSRFPKLINNIDLVIKPFEETTKRLEQIIALPGASFVANLFDEYVKIINISVAKNSPLIGYSLKDIYLGIKDDINIKIIDIQRRNESLNTNSENLSLQENDKVTFVTESNYIYQISLIFQPRKNIIKRIFIAGANYSGINLAKTLEKKDFIIKIIDPSIKKCKNALDELEKTNVIQYNPVNNNLLLSEGIDEADMFFALTNSDEINLMSSILAKKLGAKKTVITINNNEYYNAINELKLIDLIISPHTYSYLQIISFLTQMDICKICQLPNNSFIVDFKIYGQNTLSPIIGKKISEIKLLKNMQIISLMRNNLLICNNIEEIVLNDLDRILIKINDINQLKFLEKIFQVMPLYIA